jgi:hypothetical protein
MQAYQLTKSSSKSKKSLYTRAVFYILPKKICLKFSIPQPITKFYQTRFDLKQSRINIIGYRYVTTRAVN